MVSIFQHINAINVNYVNNLIGILIPPILLFGSFLYEFIQRVKRDLKEKNINLVTYFCLFALIFSIIRFHRFSDFGNDVPAHLTFILLVYYCLQYCIKKKNKDSLEILIPLLSFFLFFQKTFYIMMLIIPVFLIFFVEKKYKFLKKNLYLGLIILVFLIKNVLTTGCAVYPLNQTCIEKLSWYNPESSLNAKNVSISGEAWAKSWNTQKELNFEEYLKGFNWLENWAKDHLLTTILNKSISIIVIILVLIFISLLKNNYLLDLKKSILILYQINSY